MTHKLAAIIAAAVVVSACGAASVGDGQAGAVTTTGAGTPSVAATSDEAVVDTAADFWPEPEGAPHDFRSLPYQEWLAHCVGAFGFRTTMVNTPGQPPTLFADVTKEQLERWVEVQELCRGEAEERGWVLPRTMNESQLRAEYDQLVAVNDCLTELGYGTDPISWDTYRETRDWNVYANTPRGSLLQVAPSAGPDLPEEVRRQLSIQEACPVWASWE